MSNFMEKTYLEGDDSRPCRRCTDSSCEVIQSLNVQTQATTDSLRKESVDSSPKETKHASGIRRLKTLNNFHRKLTLVDERIF